MIGRHMGQLQCAMAMNNPVGLDTSYTNTKVKVIADRISQLKKGTDTLLGFDTSTPDFPQLKICEI